MITRAKKEILLGKYAANLSNSANKNHYLSYAREFLNHTNELSRASIDQYISDMHVKHKPGTVNFTFRVIRRLFAVNNLPWDYRQGEAPLIKQRDEYRPQLSDQLIKLMIAAARDGKLYPEEACFLACSTTYGLRREEMANLRPEDVHLSSGAIYIATLKFGRERYHLIPPDITPYLVAHDFNNRYAASTLSQIFWHIMLKSGLKNLKTQRLGWHTIRRSVFDGLINSGVNHLAARSFLRWKGATGEMAMPMRYYGNVVIGLNGSEPVLDEAKGDTEIFEKHPLLKYWREDGD